jgi:phage terminase large subunit
MTEPRTIRLPNDWTPRPYQMNLWRALEGGCKRAVAVWHRRSGKDSVALNWAATAMMQRVGTYFHCAPEAKHCRKITWDSIDSAGRRCIDQAFPRELRETTHENEMRIKLVNGSIWQAVG